MSFMPQENSRATKLYNFVTEFMPGEDDEITYEQVLDIIDFQLPDGVQPGQILGGVVEGVNKRLHRNGDWRHLQNRPRWGYYIGTPSSLRTEVLGRRSNIERQMVKAMRATEKVTRHPGASVADRRRASDAVSAQASLLTSVRREHRAIRDMWPEDEQSPVTAE